ncbi:hypothetical protein CRG98_036783 [Punica granatum]|uniref:lipoyl(octanoyl) transferase n=1 Tax=Punica granatum TaxID=22663 RepID=A0A2I0IFM9_PUNGR|nr:hypothetical protein CRG98_036783 [Punica granatum]
MRARRVLEICRMGVINYADALKLQEKLVLDRKAGIIPDTLLSLQHPPTYTLGKRRTDNNLLIPLSDLKKIGAQLHYTQRGGDITFHGPRQAILYPIIALREMGLGARLYVEKLERTMIELSSQYGVRASPGKSGETGVWVEDRKIGAIGHIVPCGIANKEVTSLKREAEVELPAEDVVQDRLVSCFVEIFGYDSTVWKGSDSLVGTI